MEKKQCIKCGVLKEIEEFGKASKRKDGLHCWCKLCCKEYSKEYWQENQEELNLKSKERYEENKEKISLRHREYYYENQKELILKNKSPLSFTSTSVIELKKYEEVREASNGNLECKCTYCGSWFEPTRTQIDHRLSAINGTVSGEARLYCSDGCKVSCPIFGQRIYPKNYKKANPNEVDPELRKMVLARDEYYCQRCGKHKYFQTIIRMI